jgi:ADP-ribosylglycohydrolase
MCYPDTDTIKQLLNQIADYSALQHEYEAYGLDGSLHQLENYLKETLQKIKKLPINEEKRKAEPDTLPEIRAQRIPGPRKMWKQLDETQYLDKLEGALYARLAGCTLGTIVEGWSVQAMKDWAEAIGDAFPPVDYWSSICNPHVLRYGLPCYRNTRNGMDGVPPDDDTTYTFLNLLIAETYGPQFTTEEVAEAWIKYLPYACTAEEVVLKNLKNGVSAQQAADVDNPYCQWIGADIRSDTWAYIAPGCPEKAAELAYRDAFLSHRRNGIYGAMYFAAAQSAAFAVDNAEDALRIALTEIPCNCALFQDISWSLEESRNIHTYMDARDAVDARFPGMHPVHTNNNACLTVFGLLIGAGDVGKTISELVAMGMDNDCTAATAGSIVGAIAGKKRIDSHWIIPFHNRAYSYINGHPSFAIDNLIDRYAEQTRRFWN